MAMEWVGSGSLTCSFHAAQAFGAGPTLVPEDGDNPETGAAGKGWVAGLEIGRFWSDLEVASGASLTGSGTAMRRGAEEASKGLRSSSSKWRPM